KVLFRSFYTPEPLPEDGTFIDSVAVKKTIFGGVKKSPVRRPFQRSPESVLARRRRLQIGIPRVLNIYSTAPIWRTYFEALGLKSENIVFSDYTSEELWAEGGKYGSIDPCYPSKVCQAHIHNLLFRQPRHALDYIFFPCITHVPTFVVNTMDDASCPIVAGAPKVVRAAFTKEVDFFASRGIEYVDGAVTLVEPNYFARQMFEMWSERLGITEDENDWACRQGLAALRALDEDLQRRGLEILQALEEENKVGVLLLGRPYHLDPGLNHNVLDEFQALGYPILSIRSVPKDPKWLARFFKDDLDRGFVESPLDVSDVWPENYSANSVQKVWAAKFAARHPNVVVLDLSSFKCGHDAPTYGLIDNIISSSRTPYSALHDIDANKPSGSIKIRVKTYAHTLARHEERLQDLGAARSELQRRVDAKRHALMRDRQLAAAAALRREQAGDRRGGELDGAYESYLQEDPVLPAFSETRREADVAPLPPTETVLAGGGRGAAASNILWMKEIDR
ncbi:MAG TPA: acyl-CoA dehydratase activase-related protein, partial [Vicinamibacterales bacterium]|nr:acyl-CoA dehydratase activase-related protein [Vicinamibacterales bacterium]